MSEAVATPEATPEATATPEPAATPAAAPASVVSTWRDGLEPDLRSNPSLEKFKDVGSLAKSYVEVQGLVGKKGIIKPGENATEEQVSEYYKALGRPDDVSGYELDTFEVPEVLADVWDMNATSEVAAEAFRLGVTKEQFNGLLAKQAEVQAAQLGERVQAVKSSRENTESVLKEKWGMAYDGQKDLAQRSFKTAAAAVGIDPAELAGSLLPDGGTIGDNPHLALIFAKLGEGGKELGFLGGKGGFTTKTPESAQKELDTLNLNPALYDRSNPEHKALVEKRDALLKMAYQPEDAA
jgi:hypothetical protein